MIPRAGTVGLMKFVEYGGKDLVRNSDPAVVHSEFDAFLLRKRADRYGYQSLLGKVDSVINQILYDLRKLPVIGVDDRNLGGTIPMKGNRFVTCTHVTAWGQPVNQAA